MRRLICFSFILLLVTALDGSRVSDNNEPGLIGDWGWGEAFSSDSEFDGTNDLENWDSNVEQKDTAKYSYGYGVHDTGTGDIKSAQETSEGGLTKGSYSVLQPDGILRTVTYVSDPWNGFRATVHNKGWGLRQNSHGWGGFEYDYKGGVALSVPNSNRH